jgi:hypothetical protein
VILCHHGVARLQATFGENGLQIWTVTANILNKQSVTAEKRWSSTWGVVRRANNSSS